MTTMWMNEQPDDPMLELTVKVININTKAGHPLLEKCEMMRQYSIFIDTIRKYQEMGDTEAYKHAIEECIGKDILAEYLRKNGSEVINMLQAEYDYEMDIEVQREEAFEDGVAHGEARGKARGKVQGILEILQMKGGVDTALQKRINEEQDIQVLTRWFTQALRADTAETFEKELQ